MTCNILQQRDIVCCVFDFLLTRDIYNFSLIDKYTFKSIYKKKYYQNYKLNQ